MDPDDRFAALTRTVAAHEAALLSRAGVTGVGCGLRDGALVVVVMVDREEKAPLEGLPDSLDGFPIVVEAIGEITAY